MLYEMVEFGCFDMWCLTLFQFYYSELTKGKTYEKNWQTIYLLYLTSEAAVVGNMPAEVHGQISVDQQQGRLGLEDS